MEVYVYADESGNSGRNIFDPKSLTYYQGAIISLGDADEIIGEVINRHCARLNVPRIHSNEHLETEVALICDDLIGALSNYKWKFFYCVIHKPYIVPTKFVDLFFDSYDNPGVPMLWYTTELLRHSLCLAVNHLLTEDEAKTFWDSYLSDDISGLISTATDLRSRLDRIGDPRMKEVMESGLAYAISHPDQFALICTQGKSAYKKQTPNLVAFSSLMAATHSFCKENGASVKQLIHDRSDEFRGTMREYHRIFHKLDQVQDEFGGPVLFEEAEFDLGTFDLRGSASHPALQAVDVFLWMLQRDLKTEEGKTVFAKLQNYFEDFVISPAMSNMIVQARIHQLHSAPLSKGQLRAGKKLSKKLEANRQKRLRS